eukprot:COSAG06_NODE_59938_length_272_cov_1.190751_1_plen_52_part_01
MSARELTLWARDALALGSSATTIIIMSNHNHVVERVAVFTHVLADAAVERCR